jgi:hypothetical protein
MFCVGRCYRRRNLFFRGQIGKKREKRRKKKVKIWLPGNIALVWFMCEI